ncbi:unnamed protein product [Vitrella brassicaformis CCMP3155]|uniref:VTT domain-containing protein n=1 Tax=Vitrella brassicaformis (strain CCMP3155) TaxID=1169540 RepID=A0A0G4EUE5_VITBC|nr:unnamed protein product [Vitrella brassicaformis CCMP3155]|eukprot:CEM01710.1 unnamed protein product [Vitrella brassicaformis CCMP3155]
MSSPTHSSPTRHKEEMASASSISAPCVGVDYYEDKRQVSGRHVGVPLGTAVRRESSWWPIMVALKVVLAAILMLCLLTVVFSSNIVEAWTEQFLLWVKRRRWMGALVFTLTYSFTTVFFVPAEALTIGGGYIFTRVFGGKGGFVVAFVLCFIGAYISMFICFVISRYLLYNFVHGLLARYRTFRAVNDGIKQAGIKVVALLRLAPVVPFTLLNYVLGTTSVSLKHYLIGSIFYSPILGVYIYVGSTMARISDASKSTGQFSHGPYFWVTIGVGCIVFVCAVVYIVNLTRQQLRLYDQPDTERLLPSGSDQPAIAIQEYGGPYTEPLSASRKEPAYPGQPDVKRQS